MNVTCPTCKTAFDISNPVSQAGGRKGGKARNARKGFGSWTKADWKRHKARPRHHWNLEVDGSRFCGRCGEVQVEKNGKWKTPANGKGLPFCGGGKGGSYGQPERG